jgi:hypothetical protein
MFATYTHSDGRVLVLGKADAVRKPTDLQFEKYLAKDIPPAPPSLTWYGTTTSWGMMANNTLGCCTISSKGHDLQVASQNTTGIITMTDQQIIQYYSLWDGYVPGNPNTDNGGVISDVLQKWHQQRMIGHRLFAYTYINPTNKDHITKAIELFGVTDVGLQLPITAQSQTGSTWDVVSTSGDGQPGTWGGHDVTLAAYNTIGPVYITWGALQQATWNFHFTYSDETWSLIMGMTLANRPSGFTGFSLAQLISDQAIVAN